MTGTRGLMDEVNIFENPGFKNIPYLGKIIHLTGVADYFGPPGHVTRAYLSPGLNTLA